jgi:hypothetical protein
VRAVAAFALKGQEVVHVRRLAVAVVTKCDQVLLVALATICTPVDVMHFRTWQATALAGVAIAGVDAFVVVRGAPSHCSINPSFPLG